MYNTLKSDEKTSHIPIVLLTAKATSKDRLVGLLEGADAYLTKPFNKEELFIRLNKLVHIRQVLQEKYTTSKLFNRIRKPKSENTLDDVFLQKLIKIIEDRLDDADLSISDLCKEAKLSNMQLNRKLKALTDKTPSKFVRSIRLQNAMKLLQDSSLNISEIAYKVGFSSLSYFSRSFSDEFGISPNSVRK